MALIFFMICSGVCRFFFISSLATLRVADSHNIWYQFWGALQYRASINLELDDFDDEYLEEATSSKCKHCGHVVKHDSLIVGEDGVWRSANEL